MGSDDPDTWADTHIRSDEMTAEAWDEARQTAYLGVSSEAEKRRLLRTFYEREHGLASSCPTCARFFGETPVLVAAAPCHRCGWLRAAMAGWGVAVWRARALLAARDRVIAGLTNASRAWLKLVASGAATEADTVAADPLGEAGLVVWEPWAECTPLGHEIAAELQRREEADRGD